MTDAELHDVAARVLHDWQEVEACRAGSPELDRYHRLAAYVARLTDPTPLAECLERVAGERGGAMVTRRGSLYAAFPTDDEEGGDRTIDVYPSGTAYLGEVLAADVFTAGELHRLLDALGVARG